MSSQAAIDSLRSQIRALLGFTIPDLDEAPVVHEEVHEDGFTRKLVSYATGGDSIQAFWLEPERQHSGMAVVALHQHNSDWQLGKSEIAGLAGDPLQAFGPALARSGLTVLAPDMVGFESRRGRAGSGHKLAAPDASVRDWLQYYNHAMHRLVRSELLMTKMLEDIALSVTVAQTLSGVDVVGVLGHSFGGNLALFSAALDARIAFACSSGAACSFRRKIVDGTGLEMALVIPGFATRFDIDDLMRCVAPRRLFVVSSDGDPFAADANELVERAGPSFEELGDREHLQHLRVEGGHSLDSKRFAAIVEWLAAQRS